MCLRTILFVAAKLECDASHAVVQKLLMLSYRPGTPFKAFAGKWCACITSFNSCTDKNRFATGMCLLTILLVTAKLECNDANAVVHKLVLLSHCPGTPFTSCSHSGQAKRSGYLPKNDVHISPVLIRARPRTTLQQACPYGQFHLWKQSSNAMTLLQCCKKNKIPKSTASRIQNRSNFYLLSGSM